MNNNYVLHETRRDVKHSSLWKKSESVDPDSIIPVRIGLAQTNLHTGYNRVLEVSHPTSPSYGIFLTSDEVTHLFAPKHETAKAVYDWLVDSGIPAASIKRYVNQGWLAVNMPVRKTEGLFWTKYFEMESGDTVRLGCDEYHLSKQLSEHVDYITPGVKMSPPLKKRSIPANRGDLHSLKVPASPEAWQVPQTGISLPPDLQGCALNMTPPCWRALYNIPANVLAVEGNSVGIYQGSDFYDQNDLDLWYRAYASNIPNGTTPILASIDGGIPNGSSIIYLGEAFLDIDIAQSLVYPQNVTIYQTDDTSYELQRLFGAWPGYFNTFLDALDGSYCNYTAFGITGDTPNIDPSYPDPPYYNQTEMCGTYKPTKVISISYGTPEASLPLNYVKRQCNEFMKLALQGVTFLVASGDSGVGSKPDDSGCLSGSGQNATIYNPYYPASCPYVTAVGGTQLQSNQTVQDPESALQLADPAHPRFASGGGFSNYFPQADYQNSAVASYFAEHDPGHLYYVANANASNIGAGGGIYNRNGRAYPDVSANGANMPIYVGGGLYKEFGTSLAAPIWASVITLINQERQTAGKGPVGFLNPTLYFHASLFNDIKNGSNPNCESSGFSAVEGWDPITGLGTLIIHR
ncbi:MAG: hypothetical protein M1821_007643 [Bathelium mastoideum]|nr:MAG: hypothetical protein M1821_007643 [Bathelium mastoideum]